MKNGPRLLALSALLTMLSLSYPSIANPTQTPPLYVPVGIYYHLGKPVDVKAYFAQSTDDLKECTNKLSAAVAHLKESGQVSGDEDLLGACLPIPSYVGQNT